VDGESFRAAVDKVEIENVLSRAIVARDSGLWAELADCYHPDATLTTSWFAGSPQEFVTKSQEMKIARQGGESQKHMSSNYWIEVDGNRAVAECDTILYQRRIIESVELDFTTWSRRLQLLEKRSGTWRIWRLTYIYEKDRMDLARPDQMASRLFASMDLSNYPRQIRFHCWRNDMVGFPPSKTICLKGSEKEAEVRTEARRWIAGR